jgi:hypothetical protein
MHNLIKTPGLEDDAPKAFELSPISRKLTSAEFQ